MVLITSASVLFAWSPAGLGQASGGSGTAVVGLSCRTLHSARRPSVFRRGQPVHGTERPAEVARAREAPPGRDGRDRAAGQRRIGEILAAALQPPPADP